MIDSHRERLILIANYEQLIAMRYYGVLHPERATDRQPLTSEEHELIVTLINKLEHKHTRRMPMAAPILRDRNGSIADPYISPDYN